MFCLRYDGPSVPNIYEVAKRAGVSTATVSRVLSQPDVVSPDTRPQGAAGRRAPRLHAELRGQEPADAPHRQAAGHRAGHLQSVFLADSPGHRRRGAARGLRGAARRHPARRGARGALRADAEAKGGRRPDLPRPPAARRRPPRSSARWRRAARRSSTAASSRRGSASRACTSTTRTAASEAMDHLYRPRPPAHRHRHRPAGQPAQPRPPARRDGARQAAAAPSATSIVMHGDFSIESGAAAAERLLGRREPPTAIFCFNDEMAMGVLETARRRGLRVPRDLSVVGFDDIRFARYIGSAADDRRAADARDRRRHRAAAARHPQRRRPTVPESVTLPHTLMIRSSTAPAPAHAR